MIIFIKDIEGINYSIEVESNDTVKNTRYKIADKTDYMLNDFNIIYSGQWLENHKLLSDYNIQNGSNLHCSPLFNKKTVEKGYNISR